MKFVTAGIEGVFKIDLDPRGDDRGFFARMFCSMEFEALGLEHQFVQANTSFSSKKGTLRGLHYQKEPHSEDKLVKCLAGAIYDVVLDLRAESETYGKYAAFELTGENRSMVYLPKGCAHGFMTLMPNTEIMYLVSGAYAPQAEAGIRFDDPAFGIDWPFQPNEISEKDLQYSYVQLHPKSNMIL